MKKILTICACLVAGAAMAQTTPIEISDRAGLEAIANNLTGSYVLTADIDLTGGISWSPIGTTDEAHSFQGTFDGNGKTISNLKISITNETQETYVGLFGRIGSNGVVKDLKINGGEVNLLQGSGNISGNVGSIAGVNHGQIINCTSSAEVYCGDDATDIGGIAGENAGLIQNCTFTGKVENGTDLDDIMMGGIVGTNESSGTLIACNVSAIFDFHASGSSRQGQLYGQNNGSLVEGTTANLKGRTFYKDDDWNTICLPFNVAATNPFLTDATLMELDTAAPDASNGYTHITAVDKANLTDEYYTLYLNFSQVSTGITAGKPYLIKWPTEAGQAVELKNPTINDVDIPNVAVSVGSVTSADGRVTFQGLLSAKDIAALDNTMLFLGASNTLYYPNDAMTIGANRAYFQLNNGFTFGEPNAGVRSFNLNFGEEEITGVEQVESLEFRVESEEWYTLTGVKLEGKPTAPGIYICGGRRVVIK